MQMAFQAGSWNFHSIETTEIFFMRVNETRVDSFSVEKVTFALLHTLLAFSARAIRQCRRLCFTASTTNYIYFHPFS